MKFLIDVQGLHEEPYDLPTTAYNHTSRHHYLGEDGRSVTLTDLLYDTPTWPVGNAYLVGRELVFEGFHETQIMEIRSAIETGHLHGNWQPMVDLLAPKQTSLKRNNDHDSAQQ